MSDKTHSDKLSSLLDECCDTLGYQFQDRDLLVRCLAHTSAATVRAESNERLEFLGDAILGSVVCEMLYHDFPNAPEGELTRIKSILVSRSNCADISEELKLDKYMAIGKGVNDRGHIPRSILAGVIEAIIAGIYLDGGIEKSTQFIKQILSEKIIQSSNIGHVKNHKSLFQQYCQKTYGKTPIYQLVDEKGPDHSKSFKMAATIAHKVFPPAWGVNKKEAEQKAAELALDSLSEESLGTSVEH